MFPHGPRQYAVQARWVFPIEGPPLREGVVRVDGDRIVSVGAAPPRGTKLYNFGNFAVLPGLVNAHVHLDFSKLKAPLGKPGMPLPEWLETVVRLRRDYSAADLADSQRKSVAAGLRECLASGTTTLGNISQEGEPWAGELHGIEATALFELIGLSADRAAAQCGRMLQWLQGERTGWKRPVNRRPGLSPHSPYTARRVLVSAACEASKKWHVPLAMHLAESREELELLAHQQGPLVDVLSRLDAWDPDAIKPGTRPLDYLKLLSEADRALVIHGNYFDAEERAYLAAHNTRMAVVYCPRTHHYFGHERYPLAEMLHTGVTVALGTDGRGSNPDLNLFSEMRYVASSYPDLPLCDILRLGTLNGAKALGREDRVGSIRYSKDANILVVRLPEHDAADPHELLFHADAKLIMTVYHGRAVHPKFRAIEDLARFA